MQIHVTESIDFTEEQKARLEKLGTVKYFKGLPDADELVKRAEGADILAVDWSPIDAAIPRMKQGVKLISVPYTGVGFLPLKEAAGKGIKVANVPGFSTESVGEFAVGLILSLVRKIYLYSRTETKADITPALFGMKIGILGAGRIGKYVGRVAESLGMKVAFWGRGGDLTDVLKTSDVIFCSLPLSEDTRELIGKKEFALMKHGSYFVSIAPEAIYDQDALLEALNDNLAGAAMDLNIKTGDYKAPVYLKFRDNPKVLITPHVAYNSHYAIKRGYDMQIDNIEAFVNGRPINITN